MRVGFVINPIAGMGGAVGLKGTDGAAVLKEAVDRGAKKVAVHRAITALMALRELDLELSFLTCAGEMGESALKESGFDMEVVHSPGKVTQAEDTIEAARQFLAQKVELVIFVGGDGTARDVVSVLDASTPLIGVPSGVKMHSGVFVNTPQELADLVHEFGSERATRDAEVMDIDEDSFREGIVLSRLYGLAKVPDDKSHLQPGKQAYHSGSADDEAEELGQYLADSMEEDVLYILGPGSTTAAVAKALDQPKTLLGVDVYENRRLLSADCSEADLLRLVSADRPVRIVVSPIGAQGFVLGRGNQQISPELVKRVGLENFVIVATPSKLAATPVLRVDTGDALLDDELRRPTKVVTGYKRRKLVPVE